MRRLLVILLLIGCGSSAGAAAVEVPWIHSEQDAFAQAARDKRFVLLYLEAVWCHWCHVMDHQTYADAAVRKAIAAHYVPLRIDQDARPDLANRYRDYGWPATIVFASDGAEVVKRQGFIEPKAMARLLNAIVRDPSPAELAEPEPAAAESAGLSAAVRDELKRRHRDAYDPVLGGLATGQKFLDRDSVEYSMILAADGDASETTRAQQSLTAAEALIDPVWGGVYQYSTGGAWQRPHFEKLATLQGEYLRSYSLAYAQFGDARYRGDAEALRRYLRDFLESPEGGYFVSQDADLRPGEHSAEYFALGDAARRAQGVPRIDRHVYARETGLVTEGLAAYYEATGAADALAEAERAVAWALQERALPDGGFRHDARDSGGPYLGDSLAMGRALLALYRVTGKREYLAASSQAADFIGRNFQAKAGFVAGARGASPIAPLPQLDENLSLGRFANLLARYSGKDSHRALAEHALDWLAQPKVGLSRITEAGILLLDRELAGEPLHLTVVGRKDDPAAAAMFQAVLRVPGSYKRLEWWDRGEGPLPNPDVEYPPLKRAAAFVCTNRRCSVPLYKPEDVAQFLAESRAAASTATGGD